MALNDTLLRITLILFAAVAYTIGFGFWILFKDDLKHFSAGYWAAVTVLVMLAPVLVGIAAGV
ncbi:hypothetical protein [Halomontanus rarus]|uniref:hypothetical protein n=1 Tax=Halomontanus rarus TaxID=3034020 RepID=UPI001A98BB48